MRTVEQPVRGGVGIIGYPVKLKTHNVDHSLTVGRLPVSYFKVIVYFTVKGYWRVVFFCIRR